MTAFGSWSLPPQYAWIRLISLACSGCCAFEPKNVTPSPCHYKKKCVCVCVGGVMAWIWRSEDNQRSMLLFTSDLIWNTLLQSAPFPVSSSCRNSGKTDRFYLTPLYENSENLNSGPPQLHKRMLYSLSPLPSQLIQSILLSLLCEADYVHTRPLKHKPYELKLKEFLCLFPSPLVISPRLTAGSMFIRKY